MVQTALQICQQPLEMLARRDVRRSPRPAPKAVLRAKSAPRRHGPDCRGWNPPRAALSVDVERNIIIPDVIVRKAGRSNGTSGQQNFIVSL